MDTLEMTQVPKNAMKSSFVGEAKVNYLEVIRSGPGKPYEITITNVPVSEVFYYSDNIEITPGFSLMYIREIDNAGAVIRSYPALITEVLEFVIDDMKNIKLFKIRYTNIEKSTSSAKVIEPKVGHIYGYGTALAIEYYLYRAGFTKEDYVAQLTEYQVISHLGVEYQATDWATTKIFFDLKKHDDTTERISPMITVVGFYTSQQPIVEDDIEAVKKMVVSLRTGPYVHMRHRPQ